jgi:hypothetical protein
MNERTGKRPDRYKEMADRLRPFVMARENECPAWAKFVLLLNGWMNPWAAVNELERLSFRNRKRRTSDAR